LSSFKTELITELIKPTERDKQTRVGPSELGNPCPRCLGRALMGAGGGGDFSLYPWIGTAVHAYLEDNVFPDAQHELKLVVGEVPGYGEVKGTTDLYRNKTVVDWKVVGIKKIREYRVKGMRTQYRYQAQLYAKGCERIGLEVESIAIVCIPRDDGDPNNIWVYEEAYQPEMADAVLSRAGLIYERALKDGWASLPSDEDCWTCSRSW
jgi:hypothetical protein